MMANAAAKFSVQRYFMLKPCHLPKQTFNFAAIRSNWLNVRMMMNITATSYSEASLRLCAEIFDVWVALPECEPGLSESLPGEHN